MGVLSAEVVAALAVVAESDLRDAAAWWERAANEGGAGFAALLLAGSVWRWDARVVRWRRGRGFMPRDRERAAVKAVVEVLKQHARELAVSAAVGKDLRRRAVQHVDELRRAYVALAAVGAGGTAVVDRAKVSASVRGVAARASEAFSKFGGSPGMLAKTLQYEAAGARSEYEEARRDERQEGGMLEERRVLGPVEHCKECILFAEWGWRAVGTLPRIGNSLCGDHCACHFVYRVAPPPGEPPALPAPEVGDLAARRAAARESKG